MTAHWQQLLDEMLTPGAPTRGLELMGEAWSGKTRRLDELTRRATGTGWQVGRSRPDRLQHSAPFGLFLDALDDLVTEAGPRLRERLTEDEQQRLAVLFPSMSHLAPGDRPDRDLYRECRAVRSLVGHLADDCGLLIVLDDLHRADADSLDLLGYLLERPLTAPVMIAVAHRPRQLGYRTRAVLAEAAARGLTRRVELGGCEDAELAALVPDGLDDGARRSLLRRSGGNPGLLLALAEMEPASPSGLPSVPAQPSARAAAAALDDFQLLGPAGRAMVGAAAVLGDTFGLRIAVEVSQLDEAEARTGLDEALAEDLVRPVGDGPDFRFRDPVVRAVAYHSAGRGWRSGAHARAAAALRIHQGPAELRAQQLLHTVEVADDDDVQALVDAAEDTVFHDPGAALRWARHALRPVVTADPLLRARAQSVQGRALLHEAEFEESAAAFQRLLAPGAGLPVALRAEVVSSYAQVQRMLGRHEAARELLREEIARSDAAGADAGAAAGAVAGAALCGSACAAHCDRAAAADPGSVSRCGRLRLAMTALVLEAGGQWGSADRAALTVLADAAGHPAHPTALVALAATEAQFGRSSDAAEHTVRAAELIDSLADEDLAAHLEAVQWLVGAELFLGRTREAEAHAERATALARRFGQRHLLAGLLAGLGHTRLRLGLLPEALACADEAEEASLASGSSRPPAHVTVLREELDLLHGIVRPATPVPEAPQPMLPELSGREREISVLVSRGHTNQRIAHFLELSPKTVETYLARIFKKLGVCSRAEVAAMVGRAAPQPQPHPQPHPQAQTQPQPHETVPSGRPVR
ncbi:AAA family ATPase [Streptomyces sp. NBC_01232]|uniref:helix-turn-helix transcriptional regulator n=1 Tax=Streptomyces sp. NBC_01232 TaxID=2903786 RepID=UPI002E149276|nr:AAA family ATPase [Streptomyces sp. NBC_01232]